VGSGELSQKTSDVPKCLPAFCSQGPLCVKAAVTPPRSPLGLNLSLAFMVSRFCLSSSLETSLFFCLSLEYCWMFSYQRFTLCLYTTKRREGCYRTDACLAFRFFASLVCFTVTARQIWGQMCKMYTQQLL